MRKVRNVKSGTVLAWHWTNGNKLRDGSPLPRKRRWLRYDGPVEMCRSGLHASESLLDALDYSPGLTLHRVKMREVVERESDKLVARERLILKSADMTDVVVKWTQECAELAKWFADGATDDAAAYYAAAAARECIEARLIALFEGIAK